jgi:hypothetical protein
MNSHEKMIESMLKQLVIVLIKRLAKPGEELVIPVREIDATGQDLLAMRLTVDNKAFAFSVKRKS